MERQWGKEWKIINGLGEWHIQTLEKKKCRVTRKTGQIASKKWNKPQRPQTSHDWKRFFMQNMSYIIPSATLMFMWPSIMINLCNKTK
jgi:hypothetical protein